MTTGKRVNVTDTATELHADAGSASGAILLVNNTGGGSVALGGSGVTFAAGYELAPADEPVRVRLGAGESLFAISDAAVTNAVHVLVTGD